MIRGIGVIFHLLLIVMYVAGTGLVGRMAPKLEDGEQFYLFVGLN